MGDKIFLSGWTYGYRQIVFQNYFRLINEKRGMLLTEEDENILPFIDTLEKVAQAGLDLSYTPGDFKIEINKEKYLALMEALVEYEKITKKLGG